MSSKLQMKFTTDTFQNNIQYQNNFYIKILQKIVLGSVFFATVFEISAKMTTF